jgi:hypothetical protein
MLCDSPCEGDETLCPSCLADPDALATHEAALKATRDRASIERLYQATRFALALARNYLDEGGSRDERALACIEEARRCREAIRAIRRGERLPIPGLKKATPSERAPARRAASR